MKTMRQVLAITLCLVMCFSMLPTWALAEDALYAEEVSAAELMQEEVQQEPIEEQEPAEIPEPEKNWVYEEPTEESQNEITSEEPIGETTTEEITVVSEEENAEPPKGGEEPSTDDTEASAESSVENEAAVEAVQVVFHVIPEDAEIKVYIRNEQDEKTEIDPEEDGSYLLLPGEYYYTLTAEDYVTAEEEMLVVEESEEPLEVEAEMSLAAEEPAIEDTEEVMLQSGETDGEETAELMASSGTCGDNLTWTLDDSGTLTISGTGKMKDFNRGSYKDPNTGKDKYYHTSPFYKESRIKKVVIEEGVTSVGNLAFENCENITEIILPDGLQSIGEESFNYCKSLKRISIPESVSKIGDKAFRHCYEIKTAGPIGGGYNYEFGWTETIPANAFSSCTDLEKLTIPGYISSMPTISCEKLRTAGPIGGGFDYEYGWEDKIPANAFSLCTGLISVVFPENITLIGDRAFSGCSSLTNISLPNNLKSIGGGAFIGCTNLTGLILPGTVTVIGEYAFSDCSSFTSVIIPDGVKIISRSTFNECYNLVSVSLPYGIQSIDTFAFYKCSSLTNISIPETVTAIGEYAFEQCGRLKDITIPNGVKSIGTSAFSKCTELNHIRIPASVTSFGYSVLKGCVNLKNAGPIGGGYDYEFEWVDTIPERAFDECDGIKSITFPRGFNYIKGAFNSRNSITSLYFLGDAPARLSSRSFDNVEATAYYPIGARWTEKNFQDYGGKLTWKQYSSNLNDFHMSQTELSLVCQQSKQLSVDKDGVVLWRSKDKTIATVNNVGVVTAKKAGTTEIIASSADGSYQVSCKINALFTDVASEGDYFFNPVYWAVDKGITSGTSATTFSPNKTCTRGQIVTFLWKAMGSPEPSSANNPFIDVKDSDYFYKPVLWAKENGVTSGTSTTTFSPGKACTRGQIMTFLWIALGRPEPSSQSNPFTDVSAGDYFYKPVLWAVENGITSGTSTTTFSPGKACTRAQAMTFLYKAMNASQSGSNEPAFIVSYNVNGGSFAPESQAKYQGQKLILTSVTPVRSNESINSYTVTLNANGGSVSPSSITAKKTVTYLFKTWNTKADGSGTNYAPGASYTADANVTLYAQWASTALSAEAVSLPTPTYNYHVFKGWSASSNASQGVTGSYVPSEDMTLYAIWEEKEKYTITYDANGGNEAPSSQVKYNGETLRLTTTKPVRSSINSGTYFTIMFDTNGGDASLSPVRAYKTIDYTFKNWNTHADGSGTSYAPGTNYLSDESMTLYAQWNSSMSASTLELPTLTRNHYTFRGWSTDRTALYGSKTYTPTSDVTLYAIWKEEYTVAGTLGNLSWKLYNDGLLKISGKGKMEDLEYKSYEDSDTYAGTWRQKQYRDLIISIALDPGVTSISMNAFHDCSNLTSISIPDTITLIDDYAFCGCSALRNITLPESITMIGNYAFMDCSSLIEIVIPDGVPWIPWYAFGNCDHLSSITIPDSVEAISQGAFTNCRALTQVELPYNLLHIDGYAFQYCWGLTSIIIPEGVTKIEYYAFYGCKLKSVTIPESVTTFSGDPFVSCNYLTDVYYGGTEEQWQTITRNLKDGDTLKKATIHYNSVI